MQSTTQQLNINITESAVGAAQPAVPDVPNTGLMEALVSFAQNHWLVSSIITAMIMAIIALSLLILFKKLHFRRARTKKIAMSAFTLAAVAACLTVNTLVNSEQYIAQSDCNQPICLSANGDLTIDIPLGVANSSQAEALISVTTDNITGYSLSAALANMTGDMTGINLTIASSDLPALILDTSDQTIKTTTLAADDDQQSFTIKATLDSSVQPGQRQLSIIYQASRNFVAQATNCQASDLTSAGIQVDKDNHFIPVTYTGNISTPEWSIAHDGNWCAYSQQQWANAVSVTADKTAEYLAATAGTVIPEADIVGYWVYIPRYAYKVLRFNNANSVSQPTNFDIVFQKAGSDPCDNTQPPELGSTTRCTANNSNRWQTHPAFLSANELDGIWVGKYELTGSIAMPTIKPNQRSQTHQPIGTRYDIIKSIGAHDIAGGDNTPLTQNSHNLDDITTHMIKNSEWGAVVYLASSVYGAGVNNVQLNGNNSDDLADGNGQIGTGITGCGPGEPGSTAVYLGGLDCLGSQYYTLTGQLASTTNNVYGIYDMAGGADEYVMGNFNANYSMAVAPDSLYVDVYPSSRFNSDYLGNNNRCTYQYCGGHALHETKLVQDVTAGGQSWGNDFSYFPHNANSPYFVRGGYAGAGNYAGIYSAGSGKATAESFATRAVAAY